MTIKEIANLAGVSISTVSKIINNKDQNINSETRNRVLKIVKEYNYTPYGMVKDLSNAKTFLLGVLLRTASQTNLMLTGILQSAQEHGYNILLFDSKSSTETELKHITSLIKNRVDGLIWEPVGDSSKQHEHYFLDQNIPVCYIGGSDSFPSYNIDFTQMGYELTQKLLEHKHTKIACLLKEKSRRSQLVSKGFKECLFDHQLPYTDSMQLYISDPDSIQKLATYHITGIVSSHYASSLMLFEQMSRLHHYVPSDLSLVSLKDDVREAISYPNISSLKIPYREFGYYVCSELIKKCEKIQDGESAYLFHAASNFDSEASISTPSYLRSKKIVVVGTINMDCTFNVDMLPQSGKTTRILSTATTLGGKGANQAVGVSKLGREVSLIGEVGNDADSSLIYETLEKEHVLTQGIHRDLKSQTGRAYIYLENDGESAITILSGANGNLSPENIQNRQHLFRNAGYCLLSSELSLPVISEAAKTAKKYGAQNILKPAALKTVPEELMKNIDILVPNRKEASVLCPQYQTIEEQAAYFFQNGARTIIITLGSKGCYLKSEGIEKYFPAADFVSVDTTGGADAFISALASYLIEGYTLEKSVKIATYAAGFCISRQSVVPALVDRGTLETHIRQQEPELLRHMDMVNV